jgi:hypothetical protein
MTRRSEIEGAQDPQQKSESFMEPRTIPKNWDVSAFESPETTSRDDSHEQPQESDAAEGTGSAEGDETKATFDPFPQPRTIPGNWEVSDLV